MDQEKTAELWSPSVNAYFSQKPLHPLMSESYPTATADFHRDSHPYKRKFTAMQNMHALSIVQDNGW